MKQPATHMTQASERGYTLLEMVCVIAIVAMVAAVLLPLVPRNTSRARLQAYAIEAASLLKADRNVAIRLATEVSTLVDTSSRAIRSGATAKLIRIPDDVRFEALLSRVAGSAPPRPPSALCRWHELRRRHCADPAQ
jgi:general secretion pathway protein H